jgi:indole-3-acetate monooxygenase
MAKLPWQRHAMTVEVAALIESLCPVLEATEVTAEQDRRMPPEAVEALRSAGLLRVASPRATGGWEADPVLEFEVYEAVSRISTSAGWTTFIGSFHTSWVLSHVGDNAIAAMFAGADAPVVAGQLAPVGRAEVVDGGMRVTGRYSWGSGINHATWVMGGMVVKDASADDPPDMLVWLAPKEQVDVQDNWYVSGMSGSGSFDYAVRDLFVPDGFWFHNVGGAVRRGGARYQPPLFVQILPAHGGLALGAGERAIEVVSEIAATKKRQFSTTTLADRGAFQRDLGHAYHRLRAARAYVVGLLSGLGDVDWTDPVRSDELITMSLGALTYVTEVSVETAALAYKYAGGSAARLAHPLQRILRDLQVAQQHVAAADTSYDATGRWVVDQAAAAAPAAVELAGR